MEAQTGAYATVDRLEEEWRPFTEAERARASSLLTKASRMCRRRWPNLDARIASGEITKDDVADVVTAMVKSAMVGPEIAVESETNTTGPFSTTRKYANPTGDLYFAKWMLDALDVYVPKARMGWLG